MSSESDYSIKITAETAEATQGVKDFSDAVSGVTEKATDAGESLEQVSDQAYAAAHGWELPVEEF